MKKLLILKIINELKYDGCKFSLSQLELDLFNRVDIYFDLDL